MLTRPIPSTGDPLPVIGLGTYRAFDVPPGEAELNRLQQVVELFLAAGGTLIDTSPMYGQSEQVLGRVLERSGVHDKVFLTTKVWTSGKDKGIAQMQQSFDKLRCQTMQMIQVHNLVDCETQLATLRAWKEQGTISYIGITHYTVSAFSELASCLKSHPEIDFCQFPYSMAERRAEDYFLSLCADTGTATLINVPFQQDGLFAKTRGTELPAWAEDLGMANWGQFFLKYLLSFSEVTCVIPATGNPDHMQANLGAGEGKLPNAAERRRMIELFGTL
ncbi:MAG: aldo/keto reductase [Rhodospirillales bacterium]|nr:aldo/keto reductase [Rhodospirillales bacterium]